MSLDPARATIPVACTLPADAVGHRLQDWRDLIGEATGVRSVDGGVAMRFAPDQELATRIGALAAAERTCCSFFEFTIRIAAGETELTVVAPPDAAPLIDELLGLQLRDD